MKTIAIMILLSMVATVASAEIGWVSGYTRKDGTYVSSYQKDISNDGNPYNNRKAVLGY